MKRTRRLQGILPSQKRLFLTHVRWLPESSIWRFIHVVTIGKSKPVQMKNEPVVTYNHMQDDSSALSGRFTSDADSTHHPISLYMIFAVDILLMCAIGFLAFQLIF